MVLRELAAKYDLKFNDRPFKKADSTINKAVKNLKVMAGAIAGLAALRVTFKFLDDIRQTGDEIDKVSQSVGVSRRALQEWEFAAGLAGVESAGLAVSMRKLQRAAVEAKDGVAEYRDEFERLGIEVENSEGQIKDVDQLLLEMADSLGTLETETERVATAQALLGRQGPKLLALFKDGSEGIMKMKQEAHDLGGVLDDELVDAAVDLTDDIHRFDFAMRGIKATIGKAVLPIMTRLVVWSTKVSKTINKIDKETGFLNRTMKIMGAAAAALGVKLLIAFSAPLIPLLKLALIFGVLYLLIDDLWTLWEGGDSLIGRFIDSIAGPGSAAEAVLYLKDALAGVVLFYREVWTPMMMEFGAMAHKHVTAASEAFSAFSRDFREWFNAASESLTAFWDDWTLGIDTVVQAIKDLISWIEKIPFVKEGLGERLGKMLSFTQRTAARAIPGVAAFEGAVQSPVGQRLIGGLRGGGAELAPQRGLIPVPGATGGGQSVIQDTEINVNVNAASGQPADVAAAAGRAVSDSVKREKRATLQALKQRAE